VSPSDEIVELQRQLAKEMESSASKSKQIEVSVVHPETFLGTFESWNRNAINVKIFN